jgi:hypothetical protein
VAFNSHPIPEDVIGEPTPVGLIQRHTTPLVQPHPLGLAVAARTRPRCSTPPPPPPAVAAAVAEGAEWEDISDLFGAEGGALPMAPVGLAQLESLRVEMAAATPSPAPAAAAAAGQANPAAAPGKAAGSNRVQQGGAGEDASACGSLISSGTASRFELGGSGEGAHVC